MHTDAVLLHTLATVPQRATDRRRPNDELLAQIEVALLSAGIGLDRWQDSIPESPQQLANSPYKKMITRLYLQDVTLESITTFAHHLVKADPSLSVSSIRLTAPHQSHHAGRTIDLAVTYLIYN